MNLPRRRRGRPHGTPRLASVSDIQAAERWLGQLQTGPADGTTWPPPTGPQTVVFGGASDIGLMPAPVIPPWRPDGERFADPRTWRNHKQLPAGRPGEDTEPMSRQPILLAGQQAPWIMELNPGRPGAPTPQALEVVRFLRDRVAILRRRGQLDRISDEKLAMLPGLSRRATARVIVDEAAELLRCGGEQR